MNQLIVLNEEIGIHLAKTLEKEKHEVKNVIRLSCKQGQKKEKKEIN